MNEIVAQVEPVHDMQVSRSPKVILDEAQIAAKALKDVISKKEKPVKFNGEQYLEFEDWQTIAKFYGLVCSTLEPEEIMVDGVVGAKAKAQVVDVKTGQVIGQAAAWCLRDEPNWRNKPLYQLGSMAQTRAGSKALRNLLSWVVVLAGYKTTPAEEIQGEISNDANEPSRPLNSVPEHNRVIGNDSDVVHDILDKLVAMHHGNQEEVEEHLKQLTTNPATGRWVKVSDLERIASTNPKWISVIHSKVVGAFNNANR